MKLDFSERITEVFISNGIVKGEDRELYTYSLNQVIVMMLNILLTIGIGLIFRMFWQTIIFMLSYIPLRVNAGGYHSKTQFKCYLFSMALITSVLILIKFLPWSSTIYISIWLFSGAVIFYLSPIENFNKPLSQNERSVYRKKSLLALVINLITVIALYSIGETNISACITIALLALSIMLLLGKYSKKTIIG